MFHPLFENAWATKPKQILSLPDLLDKCNDEYISNLCETIRKVPKGNAAPLKKKLPAFQIDKCCTPEDRNKVAHYHNLIGIDVDKKDNENMDFSLLRKQLEEDPLIHALYTSASGGLRIICKVNTTPIPKGTTDPFHRAYNAVKDYIECFYDITTDDACWARNRIYFLGTNPYYNENSLPVFYQNQKSQRNFIKLERAATIIAKYGTRLMDDEEPWHNLMWAFTGVFKQKQEEDLREAQEDFIHSLSALSAKYNKDSTSAIIKRTRDDSLGLLYIEDTVLGLLEDSTLIQEYLEWTTISADPVEKAGQAVIQEAQTITLSTDKFTSATFEKFLLDYLNTSMAIDETTEQPVIDLNGTRFPIFNSPACVGLTLLHDIIEEGYVVGRKKKKRPIDLKPSWMYSKITTRTILQNRKINPHKEWLESLPAIAHEPPNNPYESILGKYASDLGLRLTLGASLVGRNEMLDKLYAAWAQAFIYLAAVFRIYERGFHITRWPFFWALDSGIGKSALAKYALPPEMRHYFSDSVELNTRNRKELIESVAGKLILEITEQDFRNHDMHGRIKTFLRQTDETSYRAPYDKTAKPLSYDHVVVMTSNSMPFPPDADEGLINRVSAIAATTHEELAHPIYDQKIPKKIGYDIIRWLNEHRIELWQHAIYYYKNADKLDVAVNLSPWVEETINESNRKDFTYSYAGGF